MTERDIIFGSLGALVGAVLLGTRDGRRALYETAKFVAGDIKKRKDPK